VSRGHLLDTVVVSELRKGDAADARVLKWRDSSAEVPVYLSAVTLLEIRKGIRGVARRDPAFSKALEAWYRDRLIPAFEGRVLPVDSAVAERAGDLAGTRSMSSEDALIAATALQHDLVVITRNTRDFLGLGVAVGNPWCT
jgi:predicted nucleic acid-binding protein